MGRLLEIIERYSSDTNVNGTDKTTIHSYGPIYETLFDSLTPKTILEIGVYSGAFLRVLAEYYNTIEEIIGIDITLNNIKFPAEDPVKIYQLDGTNAQTAVTLGRRYDLIIEDASHHPEHQKMSLMIFADYLNPGGVYIIEDIAHPEIRESLQTIADVRGLEMEWHDLRSVKGRFDDILAVFRKPAAA